MRCNPDRARRTFTVRHAGRPAYARHRRASARSRRGRSAPRIAQPALLVGSLRDPTLSGGGKGPRRMEVCATCAFVVLLAACATRTVAPALPAALPYPEFVYPA